METPAHAAVASTVALAQGRRLAPYRGLVNAVLRRASREHGDIAALDAPRLNTPDWLWRSWCEAYGEERCRAIAEAHLGQPPLDLSPVPDAGERVQALCEALGAKRLPGGTLRLRNAGEVTRLKGYDEGAWWVQDAAAALPVRLLGPVAGKRVLEIGAAPGGKTAQLAAAGARVTAVDRSGPRLARLRKTWHGSGWTPRSSRPMRWTGARRFPPKRCSSMCPARRPARSGAIPISRTAAAPPT